MKQKISFERFLERAMEAHGNKYSYDETSYISQTAKMTICCNAHGPFLQTPSLHIGKRKQGCPQCGKEKISRLQAEKRNGTEKILLRFKETHGEKYDYKNFTYLGLSKKSEIVCPIHGSFFQTPMNHLRRQGCPKCAVRARAESIKLTHDDFVERARLIHGDYYKYVPINSYKGGKTAVRIICPEHGEFSQCRNSHLLGKGCTKCAAERNSRNLSLRFSEFVDRANEVYHHRYSYLEDSWKGTKHDVTVICEDHGEFTVKAASHLLGTKCPRCKLNVIESQVFEYLRSLTSKEIKLFDRELLNGKEIDILVGNLAIEINGVYWHSYSRQEMPSEKNKHKEKHIECEARGIKLLQILDIEWEAKEDIICSMIKNQLGINEKIYARKCTIKRLNGSDAKAFLDRNHMQGYRSSLVHYALIYREQIVAVLSMSGHPKYDYEMIRYCNVLGTTVIGGLTKLMKRFEDDFKPTSMVSYADKRFFNGKSYLNAGFLLDGSTTPNYMYIKGKKTFSRQKCQKARLPKWLSDFRPEITESQNMFNNGFRRIWDAGSYRYIKLL